VLGHLLPLGSDDTAATNVCGPLTLGRQAFVVVACQVLLSRSESDAILKNLSDTHHISRIEDSESHLNTVIPSQTICQLTD
jgi:hypothetical protein